MIFRELIERWGIVELATDLDLPAKNIRRWVDSDSIPAEWFAAVARAAERRGFAEITAETLVDMAERRRLERAEASLPDAAA